jgi:hypothetical protein
MLNFLAIAFVFFDLIGMKDVTEFGAIHSFIGQAGMAASKAIRNPYHNKKRGKLGRKTNFSGKNDPGCQFFPV